MPKILDIKEPDSGKFKVIVRPSGTAAGSGLLFASNVNAGTSLQQVGTWKSDPGEDGSGLIDDSTTPGKWIFAEQDGVRSEGYLLFAVGG